MAKNNPSALSQSANGNNQAAQQSQKQATASASQGKISPPDTDGAAENPSHAARASGSQNKGVERENQPGQQALGAGASAAVTKTQDGSGQATVGGTESQRKSKRQAEASLKKQSQQAAAVVEATQKAPSRPSQSASRQRNAMAAASSMSQTQNTAGANLQTQNKRGSTAAKSKAAEAVRQSQQSTTGPANPNTNSISQPIQKPRGQNQYTVAAARAQAAVESKEKKRKETAPATTKVDQACKAVKSLMDASMTSMAAAAPSQKVKTAQQDQKQSKEDKANAGLKRKESANIQTLTQDKKRASGKRRPATKKQDTSQREQSARDQATPSKKDEVMNNEEQNELIKNITFSQLDRLPDTTKRNQKEQIEVRNNTFSFNQVAGEEEKKQSENTDDADMRAFPFANLIGNQKVTPEQRAQLEEQFKRSKHYASLLNLVNFGSTGGVGGTALNNSSSPAASDGDSPFGPGSQFMNYLGAQYQMQVAALQQVLSGQIGGPNNDQQVTSSEPLLSAAQQIAANPLVSTLPLGLNPLSYFSGGSTGQMYHMPSLSNGSSVNGDDASSQEEEFISDEDFKKSLTEEQLRIFNAMVIAIHEHHVKRVKDFQRRRIEYLQQQPNVAREEIERQAAQFIQVQEQQVANYQNQLMAAVGSSEPPSGELAAPHWSLANAQGLAQNEDILMDEEESKNGHNRETGKMNEMNMMNENDDLNLEPDRDSQDTIHDERVDSIVETFFQQTSDQRLNYVECFKHLLQRKLQRQFESAQREIVPPELSFLIEENQEANSCTQVDDVQEQNESQKESSMTGNGNEASKQDAKQKKTVAQEAQQNRESSPAAPEDDEEDEYSEQLRDLDLWLIEMVLQKIYKIYWIEFETRRDSLPTEEERAALTVQDVFEGADIQVIEDLHIFNEEYRNGQVVLADQLMRLSRIVEEHQQGAGANPDNMGDSQQDAVWRQNLIDQAENGAQQHQLQQQSVFEGSANEDDQYKQQFDMQYQQRNEDPHGSAQDELGEILQHLTKLQEAYAQDPDLQDQKAHVEELVKQLLAEEGGLQEEQARALVEQYQQIVQTSQQYQVNGDDDPMMEPNESGDGTGIQQDDDEDLDSVAQAAARKQEQCLAYQQKIRQADYVIDRIRAVCLNPDAEVTSEDLEQPSLINCFGEAMRSSRHVFIAHGIRIHQIRTGSAAAAPLNLEGGVANFSQRDLMYDQEALMQDLHDDYQQDDEINEDSQHQDLYGDENMDADQRNISNEQLIDALRTLQEEDSQFLEQVGFDNLEEVSQALAEGLISGHEIIERLTAHQQMMSEEQAAMPLDQHDMTEQEYAAMMHDEAANQERFEEIVGDAQNAAVEEMDGERSEQKRVDNGHQQRQLYEVLELMQIDVGKLASMPSDELKRFVSQPEFQKQMQACLREKNLRQQMQQQQNNQGLNDDQNQIEQAQDMSRDIDQQSEKSAPISDNQVPQMQESRDRQPVRSPRGRPLRAHDVSGQRRGEAVPLGRLTRSEEQRLQQAEGVQAANDDMLSAVSRLTGEQIERITTSLHRDRHLKQSHLAQATRDVGLAPSECDAIQDDDDNQQQLDEMLPLALQVDDRVRQRMIDRKNQFIKENNQKARLEHLLTAIKHDDRIELQGQQAHDIYPMPMEAQLNEQRHVAASNLSLRQQTTAEFRRQDVLSSDPSPRTVPGGLAPTMHQQNAIDLEGMQEEALELQRAPSVIQIGQQLLNVRQDDIQHLYVNDSKEMMEDEDDN